MSERLLELERAVTTDPLEGSSDGDKPEEVPVSRRTSSTGLVRKSSLTIRRTLSSFKYSSSHATCLCMRGAHASIVNGQYQTGSCSFLSACVSPLRC